MKQSFEADIEVFAWLMARLDDPFANKAAVLAEADLDEHTCEALTATWRARLGDASSGDLAERFAATYARKRSALIEGPRAAAHGQPSSDPRFLSEAQRFRTDAAAVPLLAIEARAETPPLRLAPPLLQAAPEVPDIGGQPAAAAGVAPLRMPGIQETADISAFVPKVVLPFTSAPAHQPQATASKAAAPEPKLSLGTTSVAANGFIPRSPLPFQAPPAPSAAPASPVSPPAPPPLAPAGGALAPGRRLVRFDSQTGEPLQEPVWVDLPTYVDGSASEKNDKHKR